MLCDLEVNVQAFSPKIIIFHAGVNNLSKTYLYTNEYSQISSALAEIVQLEQLLKQYSMVYLDTKIVLSAIVATKDGFINARSNIVNEDIRLCCERNKWSYMDNNNVTENMLRDTVHLNRQGEDVFIHNIMTAISNALT